MTFKCKKCGRYVKGDELTTYIEIGTCANCNIAYKADFWHYFDETGEVVCGVNIIEVV